jgi:hypothetical protein
LEQLSDDYIRVRSLSMPVSRRAFLVAGQSLLAAAALPLKFLGAGAAELGSSNTANMNAWTAATFQPLISSSFAVRSGSVSSAYLTLLSVQSLNTKATAQTAQPAFSLKLPVAAQPTVDTFTLQFHLTGEKLPQGTYDLQHPTLGKFSLFIVPSGGTTYSAVISHLLNGATFTAPRPVKSRPMTAAQAEL